MNPLFELLQTVERITRPNTSSMKNQVKCGTKFVNIDIDQRFFYHERGTALL